MNSGRQIAGSQIVWGVGLFLGLVLSFVIGAAIGNQNFQKVGLILGVGMVALVCVALQSNIWMVIPLFSAFTGSILILPLPFAVNELAAFLAFGMFIVLYAMKSAPRIARFNKYDGLMAINLLYLLTVYIRNPAGLLRFETEIIGGRPYATVISALLAYLVLQHIVLTERQRYLIPLLTTLGGVGAAMISIVTAILPGLAIRLHPYYSGVTRPVDQVVRDPGAEGTGRQIYLAKLGQSIGPFVVAIQDPIRLFLFLNPFLSLLLYVSIVSILLSGFRSTLVYFFGLIAVAIYFRDGLSGLFRLGIVGVLGLITLISIQEAGYELPLSVQRTLSFLPGAWDPTAVAEARGSGEWRFEMWRQALQSERYIHSKVFGDGFGYRLSDLAGFMDMGGMVRAGSDVIQEYFLVIGAYHSGPISTIRIVGVVGLILFNLWIFLMALYAWRLIRMSKGTPFFVWALFVGSPVVVMPAYYWLIFGGFDGDLPQAILSLAALNMLSRSLEKWKSNHYTPASLNLEKASIINA